MHLTASPITQKPELSGQSWKTQTSVSMHRNLVNSACRTLAAHDAVNELLESYLRAEEIVDYHTMAQAVKTTHVL